MQRKPRGYVGKNHVTIGSDILSILHCLKMPEQVLGAAEVQKLSAINPQEFYPIAWLLELMERLDQRIGHYGLLAMGRALFKLSHEENARKVLHTAYDVVAGIDGLYHFANRGEDIGGWNLAHFSAGRAELVKTTPHHCVMEQGILMTALEMVQAPSLVTQRQCFRQGADACTYVITSIVTDDRWDNRPGKRAS